MGLQHIALRIALALGALLGGAPGVAAAPDTVSPNGTIKTGTDGVGGIEKHPSPSVHVTPGATGPQAPAPDGLATPWTDLGLGKPGGKGELKLSGWGSGEPGTVVALLLANGRPFASATLVVGLAAAPVAFKGGTMVPAPQLLLSGLPVGADGSLVLPALLPQALPPGLEICAQIWQPDASASAGVAASNGLLLQIP